MVEVAVVVQWKDDSDSDGDSGRVCGCIGCSGTIMAGMIVVGVVVVVVEVRLWRGVGVT